MHFVEHPEKFCPNVPSELYFSSLGLRVSPTCSLKRKHLQCLSPFITTLWKTYPMGLCSLKLVRCCHQMAWDRRNRKQLESSCLEMWLSGLLTVQDDQTSCTEEGSVMACLIPTQCLAYLKIIALPQEMAGFGFASLQLNALFKISFFSTLL